MNLKIDYNSANPIDRFTGREEYGIPYVNQRAS